MPLQACDKCGVYVQLANGICPSCHRGTAQQSPRRTTGSSAAFLDPFEQGPWSTTANTHAIAAILAQKRIRGADSLTCDDIAKELLRGGRFVVYEYCISVIVLTTILAIIHNVAGGIDVTEQVLFDLRSSGAEIPLARGV